MRLLSFLTRPLSRVYTPSARARRPTPVQALRPHEYHRHQCPLPTTTTKPPTDPTPTIITIFWQRLYEDRPRSGCVDPYNAAITLGTVPAVFKVWCAGWFAHVPKRQMGHSPDSSGRTGESRPFSRIFHIFPRTTSAQIQKWYLNPRQAPINQRRILTAKGGQTAMVLSFPNRIGCPYTKLQLKRTLDTPIKAYCKIESKSTLLGSSDVKNESSLPWRNMNIGIERPNILNHAHLHL
ncbi:hypothetical protein BV22DRAFT_474576 [Leucogyrophana mollusca]|uniref:Uncharacterized protein n=1 Tax=Leucogyrophana mollusca TaxID=85980 RepID=A0ACB8BHT2_9AGAM|nr:hypothetical protein BV22DRAFT_474576 [Leucogyrophana mollusca]